MKFKKVQKGSWGIGSMKTGAVSRKGRAKWGAFRGSALVATLFPMPGLRPDGGDLWGIHRGDGTYVKRDFDSLAEAKSYAREEL